MTTAFDLAWDSLKKAWYDEVDDPYRDPKKLRESDFPPGATSAERMAAARRMSETDPGKTANTNPTENFDEMDDEKKVEIDDTNLQAFIDLTETGSYRAVQDYLEHKGWVLSSDRGTNNNDVGTNPFHGSYASRIPSSNITSQGTFGTFTNTITANAGGSTTVSSNANYFGLGGLTSGGATAYTVRVISSQSFSDSYDDQTPDASSTFHTHSFLDYSTNSFGTSGDGLILSKIVTSQPAVIPSAFQDGDFNSVAGSISGRKYTGGSTTAAAMRLLLA